jgi:hypothetical protein
MVGGEEAKRMKDLDRERRLRRQAAITYGVLFVTFAIAVGVSAFHLQQAIFYRLAHLLK